MGMIRKPGLGLYVLLFLASFPAVSQQRASAGKEAFRAELLHLKDERQKSRVLNDLAEELLNNAPDSAFKYTMQARKLASKLDLKDELARSFLISGNVFYNHGIFTRAIEDFIKALQHYQVTGNKKGQAEIHQDLGLAYHYSKKPDVALSHYQKSLSLFQELKDENGVAGTLSYMGHIFEKNLEYQKALEYQQKAIKTYEKLNNQAGIAKVMDDIGSIYEDWEDYGKAFQYFSKALEINLKIDNRIAAIIDLNNIGDIYQKQGKYTEGLSYTFRSLELARQLHQKYQLRSAYRDISQTYFSLKDYQNAYAYLDSSYTVYGEVYNVETASQIAQMQVIYETQEKDKEIALLETNKRFNRLLIYIFIGVIIIICCFSLVIFNRQRLLILKNRKILEQNQRIYTAELENKQLKEQKLSDELEMRSRELTGRTLLIIQKNEILVELLDKIQQTLRKKDTEKDAELKKLIRLIEHSTQLEKDWNEFKLAFEQVHGEFFTRLQEKYPDLTSGELRLCALLRLNMDTKDLITTLGISQDSLRVNRHRLRKKLNLSQGDSLTHFIMSI